MPSVQIDLVDLDRKLRGLMASFDEVGYLLESNFAGVSRVLESEAVLARPAVRRAADTIERLLRVLEKTPEYKR